MNCIAFHVLKKIKIIEMAHFPINYLRKHENHIKMEIECKWLCICYLPYKAKRFVKYSL